MGLAEILWRVRRLTSAQLDIVRFPFGRYPRPGSAGIGSVAQSASSLGFSVLPPEFDWDCSQHPFDAWKRRLVVKADEVMQDRLSFFDLDCQSLGDPINWHKDWSADVEAPVKLSNFIDYRDFSRVGDCKLVWEPNRHHQFVVLARAYVVTGQESYASKIVDLMLDWIDKNPVGYGMNWKSPLEVGIRLINWVWALDLIRDSGALDDGAWATIAESAYAAMWDTQRKFSKGSSANNHLIGEAAGVFVAASYFGHFPNAEEWVSDSKAILEREILNQTYNDGCGREHAFGYQYFVLQFFTICFIVGQRTGSDFSDAFRERLHGMYAFMSDLILDTGIEPGMGDADSGYVLDLGELPVASGTQHVSVGGILFGDVDLTLSEYSETAHWLLGKSTIGQPDRRRNVVSRAYRESGYYLLRTSGDRNDRISVVCDCAELGYGSIAAHGHADALAFTLNVGAFEFLVDSGTYDYFSYPEWRQYFRSTRAHNTVVVDDQCQSTSLGPFLWGQRAATEVLDWRDNDEGTVLEARHDGYTRLEDPVVHRRKLSLDKRRNTLSISDSFVCEEAHVVRRYFHVAPECEVEEVSSGTVAITRDGATLHLVAGDGGLRVIAASDEEKLGWVSRGYHCRRPSHCIVVSNRINGEATFVTLLKTT